MEKAKSSASSSKKAPEKASEVKPLRGRVIGFKLNGQLTQCVVVNEADKETVTVIPMAKAHTAYVIPRNAIAKRVGITPSQFVNAVTSWPESVIGKAMVKKIEEAIESVEKGTQARCDAVGRLLFGTNYSKHFTPDKVKVLSPKKVEDKPAAQETTEKAPETGTVPPLEPTTNPA